MSDTRDHLGRHVVAVTGIGLVTPLTHDFAGPG